MAAYASDWVQLLLRWVHVITAVAWVGASFWFVWLDERLAREAQQDGDRGDGADRTAHGATFYAVSRSAAAPPVLPEPLRWFKWEAYSAWLSGFALLVAMYYAQARVYLIDRSVADIAPVQAVGISLVMLVFGWVFYDQLCKRLGFERELALAATMAGFVALSAWGLSHVLSGRGLYIEIGAMLGTIMAANVGHVIAPAQRRALEAANKGAAADSAGALRARQRLTHNDYLALPVLFLMISNHYPLAWGGRRAWLALTALLLLAAWVRHFFRLRQRGRTVWAIPIAAALGIAMLAWALAPPPRPSAPAAAPTMARVQAIVAVRCVACHAAKPLQEGLAVAPKNVVLETPEEIAASARRIYEQTVATKAMPPGNVTGMTSEERAILGAWVAAGAPAR